MKSLSLSLLPAFRSLLVVILLFGVNVLFGVNAGGVLAQESVDPTWHLFAGNGSGTSTPGDAEHAPREIALPNVYGIEVSGDAIYFSTVDDHSIWKMDFQSRKVRRIAGTGQSGLSGDGGPAIEATFQAPHEIRVADNGDVFIADTRNHCIRKLVAKTGNVETIAGSGKPGFAGEGKRGADVQFDQPHSIVLDGEGGVLVADTKNHRLRRIDLATGDVVTVSGDGKRKLPIDGAMASDVSLFGPRSLAIDATSIWLVLREGNSVWRIDRKTNRIHRVAGTGKNGHTGDGGDPLEATFRGPKGIAVDSQGNLLVVDTENHALRRVNRKQNTIETMAIPFPMKRPHGTAVWTRKNDDVYLLSDSENHRVLAWEEPNGRE